jgi:carotenoid cleavage dioxygenase-like enzyme
MDPPLPMEGVLPPDLQGTLLRIGPGPAGEEGPPGALHAIELRDGAAVSYTTCVSEADANVLWHAGKVLALAETGLPQQYSRFLDSEEFDGGLTVPIASHVHRDASSGRRLLFGVEPPTETAGPFLRLGEWDAGGGLAHHMEVQLERATWQHDVAVTRRHVVFIESPTQFDGDLAESAVSYRWSPGAEGWIGVVARDGDGSDVRWVRLDPCLVTHVLHAYDEAGSSGGGASDGIVLYVCRYPAPEKGQLVDPEASVVADGGIGQCLIGGGLGVLERWRISGETVERVQMDERTVEYPRSDPLCEGGPFRYGYAVEVAPNHDRSIDRAVDHIGLLRFDVERDEVATWNPGQYRTASEPLFVRAADGRADDEGWLLTVVHDAARGSSDLYVLDASSLRRAPQAVIHLPATLPFRAHGEWVGADRYR